MPVITPEIDRTLRIRKHLREYKWEESRYSGDIWYAPNDRFKKDRPMITESAYALQCAHEATE